MKKLLIFFLVILLSTALLFACGPADNGSDGNGGDICTHVDTDNDGKCEFCGEQFKPLTCEHTDTDGDGNCDDCGEGLPVPPSCNHSDADGDGNCDDCGEGLPVPPSCNHADLDGDGECDSCGESVEIDDGGNGGEDDGYYYKDVSDADKALFTQYIGAIIPFVPNDEYYIEGYYDESDYEHGLNFYTKGNTLADFEAYRTLFTNYELTRTATDDYGDVWYTYEMNDVVVDMAYYETEDFSVIDVFIYSSLSTDIEDGEGDGSDTGEYLYNDFTDGEKALFMQYIGVVVPFMPNDEYYVMGYTNETDYDNGMSFMAYYLTEANFTLYRALFVTENYELVATEVDDEGDTWYTYTKDDVEVELVYYEYYGIGCMALYVRSSLSNILPDDGGDVGGNGGESGAYIYTDFTAEEKALFTQYIGVVIPFMPCNLYYVEGYYDETDYENGIFFGAYYVTEADFEAYRALFTDYVFTGTKLDEYECTVYTYVKDDVVVDLVFYEDDGITGMELLVYSDLSNKPDGEGGSQGSGSSTTTPEGNEIITNNGAGLPTDEDGVFDVDFTLGTPVKDVTEQGYSIDGCPTKGSPAVLVIPVEFSDATAASRGYDLDKLNKAFLGANGTTDYYSVYEYYKIASYGQLELDITVLNSWFRPKNASTYYANQYENEDGYEYFMGDQLILDEALAYLAAIMDLSEFDSDNNGVIDAVVMINTLDIGDDDFHWAYRYWNYYTDNDGHYYEYDGVSANDYVWASFQFLHEREGFDDESYYDDTSLTNTYTYIHEFAHILGADDYYDLSYTVAPLDGRDMMDSGCGDHSAYTKFNFGWITTSRLIVADSTVTVTLDAFEKAGDTIIIANNWDAKLGAYQEYYIITYYTNSGLNAGEYGFFEEEGIVVYHINASLYKEEYDGEVYYDVYYNNTPAGEEYGTEHNLIELVEGNDSDYVFGAGESLGNVTDDSGNKLCYTFTVNSINDDKATITFTKI